MSKEKGLEIPEKLQDTDVLLMVKRLIEQKKLELENINHQILLAKSAITALQEQQVRMKNEFDQKIFQDKQQLEQEGIKKHNDWIYREDIITKNERDIGKRIAELDMREADVLKIEDERKELRNNRIEVEKLKTQAIEDINSANQLISEAQSRINTANIKEQEAKQVIAKAENLNSEVVRGKDELKIQREDLDRRLKNLEEVKKDVEPKLKELTEKEKSIDKKLNEIQVEEANISLKIEEDKKILVAIEEKLGQMRNKEIDIATREEDLLRKLAVLKT